jgi:hypothetical protein
VTGGADPSAAGSFLNRPGDTATIFVQGQRRQPKGVAFDPQGNIVVGNVANDRLLTVSQEASG